MEIKAPNYMDEGYDSCRNVTIAVLHHNSIRIPLCRDCLLLLRDSFKEYDKTTYCYQCNHFIMSESGWNYGGSCLKELSEEDKSNFKVSNAGYDYCVNCMDTCNDVIRKGSEVK